MLNDVMVTGLSVVRRAQTERSPITSVRVPAV